jgi:TolB-like protein
VRTLRRVSLPALARRLRAAALVGLVAFVPARLAAQAAPSPGQASGPVTVAVIGLNAAAIGGSYDLPALGESLTSMIMSEFGARQTVALVERQRVEDLLEQRFAATTGQLDDRVAFEVGQLLGAQYVVRGGVTMVAGSARFDLRIIDVESGEIHRTFKQTGRESDFLAIVEQLAGEFLTDLRLPIRVADVTAPPPAVLAYSRGLDFERRGDRARAAQMFRRALELFPDHADAAAALARLR